MSSLRSWTTAAVFALLVAAAVAGDDGPTPPAAPATKRYESGDRRVGIDLSADWVVIPQKPDKSVIALRAKTPPGAEFFLEVFHVPGFRDPRGQAFFERGSQPGRYDTPAKGEVSLDPAPHLVLDAPRPGSFTRKVWIYRVIDRNGFTVVVYCDPKTWPSVKDGCFAAAVSLTSAMPEWPPRPAGYRVSEREGYEYLVQPGVKDGAVATLHAAVLDLERKYAATHVPVPKPAWNRPIVVVSADRDASNAAAGQGRIEQDFSAHAMEGRLFAVPLRKDDPNARAGLAREAYQLFHAQCYSANASAWLCAGERRLAYCEAWLGRGLPSLPDFFHAQYVPPTVGTMERFLTDPGRGDVEDQATAYVAFFRAGPRPWRDAFAAFLKDLAATGDWETAERTRLLTLDQEKLRAAAQAFLKELKPVKTK